MQDSGNIVSPQVTEQASPAPPDSAVARLLGWKRLAVLAGIIVAAVICFIVPLSDWAGFAMDSEFYSYMPLMPVITGYLIWQRRRDLPSNTRLSWAGTIAACAGGGTVLGLYFLATGRGWNPPEQDYLSVMMVAFLFFLVGAGFVTYGTSTMGAFAFPVAMLVFMVPYPEAVNNWLENFFQHTSAAVAHVMYHMVGTQSVRTGTLLDLPTDFSLVVNPECSGIHSTQVLLITSLLAGNLFLSSPYRRIILALFVIPLAIVRNGFRIFVIGELCVHVSHKMIDSWIHHKGGPVFFALSLIPFFFFLIWLRKGESKLAVSDKIRKGSNTKPAN